MVESESKWLIIVIALLLLAAGVFFWLTARGEEQDMRGRQEVDQLHQIIEVQQMELDELRQLLEQERRKARDRRPAIVR